jgi:hypothetical protein
VPHLGDRRRAARAPLRGPDYGRYGFRLQLIDVDRLYELKNQALPNGGAIHSSIELDQYGRAVAYWVLKRKPAQWQFTGYNVTDFERIPADEITHVFAPEFAEQVRGVPMMYAALLNLVHLGAFEEAAVIAARIGAAQMFVIESPDGGKTLAEMAGPGPNADGTESYGAGNGDLQLQAEPGSSFTLPPGYKLSTGWNPKYPDAAIEPFIKACLRGIAAGLGVAYHNLANDMEGVNYSSARIAELDERDTWRGMQQFWIEHFCQPIFEDWLPHGGGGRRAAVRRGAPQQVPRGALAGAALGLGGSAQGSRRRRSRRSTRASPAARASPPRTASTSRTSSTRWPPKSRWRRTRRSTSCRCSRRRPARSRTTRPTKRPAEVRAHQSAKRMKWATRCSVVDLGAREYEQLLKAA